MYRADHESPQGCVEQEGVPLVLALTSGADAELRERLLLALANSCARRGGRVLVIELGELDPAAGERGVLEEAPELSGFPGRIMRGAEGVLFAGLETATQADIYVALDVVTVPPARFDLVLLHVRGSSAEELFLASLAQRVVVAVADAGTMRETTNLIERLSGRYRQRHFTLAVAAEAREGRRIYSRVLGDPALSQIECNLLDELPAGLLEGNKALLEAVSREEGLVLLAAFQREVWPPAPHGGLQLFWRSVLFCSACSLKLCREVLSSGQRLEVCPVQRF